MSTGQGFAQTVTRLLRASRNGLSPWLSRLNGGCAEVKGPQNARSMTAPRRKPLLEVMPDVINLAVGTPGPAMVPKEMIDEAFRTVLARNQDPFIYQYAKAEGTVKFREALARLLTASGMPVGPENLCVTFGNSMALASVARTFARAGQCCVVEEPTYFLAGKILADAGLRCVRVGVDEMGMKVDQLEEWLKTTKHKPALVYCIPRFHNPTSVCLEAGRAHKLLSLAAKHSFFVCFDDPYALIPFPAETSVPPYQLLHPRAITMGSFSKILSPGLRLGWFCAVPDVVKTLVADGVLISGGGPASVITECVRELIDSGRLGGHITFVRTELSKRMAALHGSVERVLGNRAVCRMAGGGYFAWVEFVRGEVPDGFSTQGLRQYCDQPDTGVSFMPAARCAVKDPVLAGEEGFGEIPDCGYQSDMCMRIALSYFDSSQIEEGIRRLGVVLERYLASLQSDL